MHNLVVFASGRGSNAQAIINFFKNSDLARVSLIVSNKADAGVLDIARNEQIESVVISKSSFEDPTFNNTIQAYKPSLIILAGFLWKVPDYLVKAYPDSIINIHPALLPKHGGKGMYGHHVHEAVLKAGEKESGITIHYVDEVYDSGNKILQAHCPVSNEDTADSLAERIHKLEHFFYPRTIEYLLENI